MRPWYRFCRALVFGLGRLLWGLRVEGRENIPETGPVLVTSNHVSNLDPPIVGCTIPREVGFVAKKELFAVPGVGRLIASLNAVPVDRARLSIGTLRTLERFLATGSALLFFPEGTRSRDGNLGKPREGVGMLLTRVPVPVIPVYVEGTDSPVRNLFRRGRMRVVFGRPYTLPEEDRSPEDRRERYRRMAETVMGRIRELKEGLEAFDRETGSRPETPARRRARPPASGRQAPNTREGR